MRAPRWLRGGLLFFTAAEALIGTWAQGWPRSFYTDFPLPGHPWVANLPSYNEHVLRDFGGLNLALAVVFGVAAVTLHRAGPGGAGRLPGLRRAAPGVPPQPPVALR